MTKASPFKTFQLLAITFSKAAWFLILALLCVLGPWSGLLCEAQVQLPTVNLGDTNFEDGFAGPGVLMEEFPGVYTANELKDAKGNTVAGSNHLTAISSMTHAAYIGQRKILGAWIGGEALLPVVDIDAKLANGVDTTVHGFGDLELGSVLQWAPRRPGKGIFVQRAVFDMAVPTGKYSNLRPVNIGNNSVSINPYYVFTYEPNRKIEVSVRAHYLWNSVNKNPFVGLGMRETQAGQAFHMNYATSYEIHKDLRVGFNGYWLQQLTDHRMNDVEIVNSKERTLGVGPGVQIGGHGLWFRANSYMETGVRNRMSGAKVTFRLSKTFGAGQPKS